MGMFDCFLHRSDGSADGRIPVHVLRPEALFGAAFLLLAKTNFDAVKRQGEGEKAECERRKGMKLQKMKGRKKKLKR